MASLDAANDAAACIAIFAFATQAGVESLVLDPVIQGLLGRSRLSLLVGLDAVTNRPTLERLRELEGVHDGLSVRVFWNDTNALFHPKVARFEYADGGRCLIVGSGNLTPGGLGQNFEAFTVTRAGPGEYLDVSSWDRFLTGHEPDIRGIDEDALARAGRNVVSRRRKGRDVEPEPRPVDEPAGVTDLPVGRTDRFLIARVPKAGGRWHQVHLNRAVVDEFFQVRPGSTQRVYLIECRQDGSFGEQEVRPCVYSSVNQNPKIKIASHRGAAYPEAGPPLVIYRELQARSFVYMLLVPGEPGYDAMFALTTELPTVGRGFNRVMTDSTGIAEVWPDSPLITAIDALAADDE